MAEHYHRDAQIQNTVRPLLPPAPPLLSPLCLRYLTPTPTTRLSVAIAYHNELPILLLRTLTVLAHRTPRALLHEIVLVDDASPQSLEREVAVWSDVYGVRVVHMRSPERLGITRARRRAIELSSGELVAVLDSHMEVGEVWVEPLLAVIADRPRAVAAPCIKMIFETNYSEAARPADPYTVSLNCGVGSLVFDGRLPHDMQERTVPYRSPSLAGGALLATRQLLLELFPKTSPSGSKGWGVENSRLAVRAWLCAGGIWMSCCRYMIQFE